MPNTQPDPDNNSIHPELLADIPPEWRQAMTEFLATGSTLVHGFDQFIDSSEVAQNVIDIAFQAHMRGAAQKHLERIEKTGGTFQAAESISGQAGISLSDGIKIGGLLEQIGDQLRLEQRELDGDSR